MLKNKRKIIIIISAIALVAVICLLILSAAGVFSNQIKVKTLKEAYETAAVNGYKGSEEEFKKLIKYYNDYKKTGISDIYINDDKKIIIVLDSGKEILVRELTENEAKELEIVTVIFKDYDGKVIKTENVIKGKKVAAPPEPQREGYTFTEWDKGTLQVYENTVITAQYEKITGPTLKVSNVTVKNGQYKAQAQIEIFNNPGLASLAFELRFERGIEVTAVNFESEKIGKAQATAGEPFNNPQRISLVSPTSEMKFNGVFATVEFKIPDGYKAGDIKDIGIAYDKENIFDADLENVDVTAIGGKLFITK